MKKLSIIFVLSALIVSGCRENYLAEKSFFQANHVLRSIKPADLEADPIKSLDPAIQAFQKVAEQYPTTQKAADSLFTIAKLRVKQKKYEDAIQALRKVIPNFTGRGELVPNARFFIAQLHEVQGFWQKAEKAYWETAIYHPLHARGLYAPLYIVLHYKQVKDKTGQAEAYQKAVEHYKRMLDQVGPIEASAGLRNSLALTYLAQGNLGEARTEWLAVAEQFPKSAYAPMALLTIAELSWRDKEFEQSFTDYNYFFERYPRHALAGKTAVHVGLLYAGRKEFAKAREWYDKAITQYFQKDLSGVADIKLLIGKSYQDEEFWEQAEKVYSEIETKYPITAAALQVPFMKFMHYDKIGQPEIGNKVLDEAIVHYKKLMATENRRSKMARYAEQFTISAYAQKKDWNQLLAGVDQALQKETVKEKRGRWLFLKALITENNLKDRERALTLYQDFLAQYPGHPLFNSAKNHQEILARPSIS